jgi:hypothetical protein
MIKETVEIFYEPAHRNQIVAPRPAYPVPDYDFVTLGLWDGGKWMK